MITIWKIDRQLITPSLVSFCKNMVDARHRGFIWSTIPGLLQRIERGKLTVSKIYSWFKEDFGDSEADVVAHLVKYSSTDQAEQLRGITRFHRDHYDWRLNAARE
jgi:hypothetical protein